uniref:Receptor ligand binding region domain-containing protein n=1 Tax=Biomphalaria glabrata TaxID=6526 RepID=A0A2C9KJ65_BIOGL
MIKSRSVLKRINLQLLITSMMATPLSVLKLTMYFLVYAFHQVTPTTLIMKRQPPLKYVREGDVNLGAILPGLGFDHAGLCGQSSFMNSSFHFSEAVIFAVDEINRNQSLLPNVQLGLVVLDDCMKESTAAIQAIRFVKTVIQDGSFLTNQDDVLESYDVAGVVGCFRSSNSMHAASILGPAEVPLVSFSSTSEALSDKEAFPYFLRVVPADNYL